jgi:hypothetical protein
VWWCEVVAAACGSGVCHLGVPPECVTWVCHRCVPAACASGEIFLEWYVTWQEKLVPLCWWAGWCSLRTIYFLEKGGGQENINQQRVWRQGGARTKLQRIYIVYRNNQLYAYELSCLCIKLLQCQALEIIIIKHRNWFTKYSSYDLLMPPDWITCSIMQVCEITYFM